MADIHGTTNHANIAVMLRWWGVADAANNRTTVTVEFYARRTNTGWTTYGTFNGGINIDGVNYGISRALTLGPSADWAYVGAKTVTLTHDSAGWRNVGLWLYGGIPGTGWDSTSAGADVSLVRLLTAPNRPSAVTATYVSDTRANVAITYPADNPRGPVSHTEVERYDWANPGWGYRRFSRVAGKPSTVADTGVRADGRYSYRVRTTNSAGVSAYLAWGQLYTTPAAPVNVSAKKNADLSVTVSWANGSRHAVDKYEIRDNGAVVATVAGTATSWVHTAPDSGISHTYTVVAVTPGNARRSAVSAASAPVLVLAPPLAPTLLGPTGYVQTGVSTDYRWRHNPVDTTEQTAYELRISHDGTTWSTLSGTTADYRSATFSDAGTTQWQVRTKGQHAGFGPWSAISTFTRATAPTVTLTDPPTNVSQLTASATWAQAEDIPAASWTLELLTDSGTLIEKLTGSGTTSFSRTFATRLKDSTDYQVRATATQGSLAATATRSFLTSFPVPATPILDAQWDDTAGGMVLSLINPGGAPTITSITIERSVGSTWEPVITSYDPSLTLTDYECLSHGTTQYRATAWTDLPSSSELVIDAVADSDAIWLSTGAEFSVTAPLPYNPDPQITSGRARAMHFYAGRALPVPYVGEHIEKVVACSGVFLDPETADFLFTGLDFERLIEVAQHPSVLHLYRDPDGQRIYGVLGDVQITRPHPGVRGYSFKLTETERPGVGAGV